MKWLFILLLSVATAAQNFDDLMGKETPFWAYVQTEKDQEFLARCRDLYEKNHSILDLQGEEVKIPKVIHFIWLGPKGFPSNSVENIRSWIAQNPGWKVKFWTDRERPLPCRQMEKCLVENFSFRKLKTCYDQADNWAQKSDILRYEILFAEGGVYVDHDASCLVSFEKLHTGFDLYAGLQVPHEQHVGHAVTAGIGVVGCRPGHPLIAETMNLLARRWNEREGAMTTKQGLAVFQATISHTYMPFTLSLIENLGKTATRDIILPAAYFYAQGALPSLYSQHFFAGAWLDKTRNQTPEQDLLTKINLLDKNTQKMNGISTAAFLISGFLCACGVSFYFSRTRSL